MAELRNPNHHKFDPDKALREYNDCHPACKIPPLPHKASHGDIDGHFERNGNFCIIERKIVSWHFNARRFEQLNRGQVRQAMAMVRDGSLHLTVWTEHNSNDPVYLAINLDMISPCNLRLYHSLLTDWFDWADANPKRYRGATNFSGILNTALRMGDSPSRMAAPSVN